MSRFPKRWRRVLRAWLVVGIAWAVAPGDGSTVRAETHAGRPSLIADPFASPDAISPAGHETWTPEWSGPDPVIPPTWDASGYYFATQPSSGLFRDRPWIVAGPSVPEPMVFDMVRPMHAARGEFEVNMLGVVPLRRGRGGFDWAPEVEYAIADGLAVEFELPFDDDRLEALKFALQYTFGTGFENRLIHGFHGIYERGLAGRDSRFTSLYLLGIRFDPTWSLVGFFGFRSTVDRADRASFTELIQNVSVFADLSDDVVVGVETNMTHLLEGQSTLAVIPQVHWDLSEHWNLQLGAGMQARATTTFPIFAFRIVYSR